MSSSTISPEQWREAIQRYTLQLVAIQSVSPSAGESQVAQKVLDLLHEDGLASGYTASGLDALHNDHYQRLNAYAFIQGTSPATLLLLGHIDTVGIADYGILEPYALDPLALDEYRTQLLLSPSSATMEEADWLFGRGAVDMKSGVAVNIALMRQLARDARNSSLPFSVVFLATVDEENESAGILHAVRFLAQLRARHHLHFVGAINTDYTTYLYTDDPHRYIYTATTGKMLPSFLCIGSESHVGTPFKGLDANLLQAALIQNLSMNDELCDNVRGQVTPPPVTLHASDLKTHYDVQLPLAAYFYLNVLTYTSGPQVLLDTLYQRVERTLTQLLQRLDATEQRWRALHGIQEDSQPQTRNGMVFTYAQLYQDTAQRLGDEQLAQLLAQEWQRYPATTDKRELSLHLVHYLWRLSQKKGPAVVIYYSPPYYPFVPPTPGALHEAVAATVAAHPELPLSVEEYYPYISDISYLRLDPSIDTSALKTNMPLWQEASNRELPGSYALPLEAIRELDIPVINWGPHGVGAHQRDERVLLSYSFETLPALLYETIWRIPDAQNAG